MSRGVNSVTLIGNLGRDPQTTYSQAGTAITKFSVAISETWRDKQTNEKKEKTEWINLVAFGRLAEICGEYLRKGSKCYVEGKLQTSSWEKDGQTHYRTEVNVRDMQMLDSRGSNDPAPRREQPAPQMEEEIEGDIPF